MFSGSFEQLNLAQAARLLVASAQTGALRIHDPHLGSGALYFLTGRIVHAACPPAARGLDALSELSFWPKAQFAFDPLAPAPEQSLEAYPTDRLIEAISLDVEAALAIHAAMPQALDRVRYLPSRQLDGFQASPEELSLLILADGSATVSELATRAGFEEESVRQTFGKFRQLGLIEVIPAAQPPPPPKNPPPPDSGPAETTQGNAGPRFWRGRRIS